MRDRLEMYYPWQFRRVQVVLILNAHLLVAVVSLLGRTFALDLRPPEAKQQSAGPVQDFCKSPRMPNAAVPIMEMPKFAWPAAPSGLFTR